MKSGSLSLAMREAVRQPAQEADHDASADPQPNAVREQAGCDHAADADDRADGEVDALGHHHQRHADGDHGVDRRLQHDVEQIARLIERARQNGEDDEERDRADGDAGAADPVETRRPVTDPCGVRLPIGREGCPVDGHVEMSPKASGSIRLS